MLRVDPFTTYAYCCRICSLEFFTVFLLFLKVQWTNAKALRVCCNMVNKRFTDKIFKNSYNPSPLAFHFFITLCATEAIVLDPFFVAQSSRCLSDSSSRGLKPPCAFCFFKYCWQVQDSAFDV